MGRTGKSEDRLPIVADEDSTAVRLEQPASDLATCRIRVLPFVTNHPIVLKELAAVRDRRIDHIVEVDQCLALLA